ncbi:MAG: GlsB/YeaQ/YmgE family stress response membrane protein, partial [Terracidiphilus sp.]
VKFGLICKRWRFRLKTKHGGKDMFHLLWYLIIGLLAGLISKSVMHVHMTLLWTIVLGIIGSVLGGGVTHMVFRSRNDRYHPAGLIFSTLGAILILFICYKLKIHLP